MTPFSRRRFLSVAGLSLAAAFPLRAAEPEWKPLFDGKSLNGWKITDFTGHGEVTVAEGQIVLDAGNDLTGINYTGEIPKMNYEVSLEAERLEGSDFFCGLTFPVEKSCVTYVVGGWGGSVVGLSSINGDDASENETTQFKKLDSNHWYGVRVRVSPGKLEAWLDNEQLANVELAGKRLGMRPGEIEDSQPFGIATFRTKAAFRHLRLRSLA